MTVTNAFAAKLKSDSLWVTMGFGINAVSALVISMLLTRILDAESVGVYFLAFSISIILSGLTQFGFNITVVRLISASEAHGETAQLRCILIKLLYIIALLGILLIAFFVSDTAADLFNSFQKDNQLSSYLLIVALWVLFSALRSYLAEVFRGFHDIKMAAIYQRILPNILVVFAIWGLYIFDFSMDLYFVLGITVGANAVLVLFALILFYKRISTLVECKQKVSVKPIVRSSAPIAIGQVFQFVVTQAPLWVLGAVSTAVDLADYGVAFRLAAIISLPLLIANNVIMPHISRYHSHQNSDGLNLLIQYTVAITSVISLVLLIMYFFMGKNLLSFFYGNEYKSAYLVLLIIGLGHLINVMSGSPAIVLAMAKKEVYVLYSSVVASIGTLLISIWIIPLYGLNGAAFATMFGLVLLNFILVYFSYKVLGYKTYLSINTLKHTLKQGVV